MSKFHMAAAVWLGAVSAASAQSATTSDGQRAVVVELYTSQGCSSCPPADAVLSRLATRDDVIALALHVDYWDYIGWADEFASPSYTMRQKAYAAANGARTIYTPQVIVDGTDQLVGAREAQLSQLISQHAAGASPVQLDLRREGSVLHIRADATTPLRQGALVQLVRYRPSETVSIERGENAGMTFEYNNIVESWTSVAEWDGKGPIDLEAPMEGSSPAVVIVQEPGPGAILAAARLK
jgi:hypothetical protein